MCGGWVWLSKASSNWTNFWTQQFLKLYKINSGESAIYSVIISPLGSPHSSESFTINCCVFFRNMEPKYLY